MTHKVHVYGTLRPGGPTTIKVPGVLYDLGWYPGIALKSPECGTFVTCEVIEVDDNGLADLDNYEGYHPKDEQHSLYLRVPYLGGWIYVYNHAFDGRKVVASGDWLEYRGTTQGSASDLAASAAPQEEDLGVA